MRHEKIKIEIIIKGIEHYGKHNAIGIHLKEPTVAELLDAINVAERDNFEIVYMYSARSFHQLTNICSGRSTWNRLLDVYEDTRCGMITRRFGQCLGQGFTIYLEEA